jgi:opacity protein-like surface antigen
MKKILLTSIATIVMSSSILADMIDSAFYLRGDIMASKFLDVKVEGNKHTEKMNPSFDFGLGYNLIGNIRTELVYTHIWPAVYKHAVGNDESHVKAFADAIMVRGIIDLVDLEVAKIYAGVGVGGSRNRHKITIYNSSFKGEKSSKFKYNLAYNAIMGTSIELSSRTFLEIGYMFADYGATKGFKSSVKQGKIALRSHNIFLGIRHEL